MTSEQLEREAPELLPLPEGAEPSYTEIRRGRDGRLLKRWLVPADSGPAGQDLAVAMRLLEKPPELPPRFCLPEQLLVVDGVPCGYYMRPCPGLPFSLSSREMELETLKDYLLNVYEDILLLDRQGLSFCDLHEDNLFVLPDGRPGHIDTDGWSLRDGNGRRSRYLTIFEERIKPFPERFPFAGGQPCGSLEGDRFCLAQILLNCLSGAAGKMTPGLREEYLSFLETREDRRIVADYFRSCLTGTGPDLPQVLSGITGTREQWLLPVRTVPDPRRVLKRVDGFLAEMDPGRGHLSDR